MDRRTAIGLVVIFALLGLYVLLVQKPQEQGQANATATAQAEKNKVLWDFPIENVAGVRVRDFTQVRTVAFEKGPDGQWVVTQPSAGPADDVLVERAIANFRKLIVLNEIPDGADLAQFGLNAPQYEVELRMQDGSSLELTIGAQTLTSSGYYAVPKGESRARVLTYFSVGDAVTNLLDTPPYVVPTATPTPQPTVDLSPLNLPTPYAGATATPVPGATATPTP